MIDGPCGRKNLKNFPHAEAHQLLVDSLVVRLMNDKLRYAEMLYFHNRPPAVRSQV